MNGNADLEGMFHLFADGGRTAPARSGYRPAHRLYDNYYSSGEHRYVGTDEIAPGETAAVRIRLVTPYVYPASLWEGRVIEVCEGTRPVGLLTVTRILNPGLSGNRENYRPIWTMSGSGLECDTDTPSS